MEDSTAMEQTVAIGRGVSLAPTARRVARMQRAIECLERQIVHTYGRVALSEPASQLYRIRAALGDRSLSAVILSRKTGLPIGTVRGWLPCLLEARLAVEGSSERYRRPSARALSPDAPGLVAIVEGDDPRRLAFRIISVLDRPLNVGMLARVTGLRETRVEAAMAHPVQVGTISRMIGRRQYVRSPTRLWALCPEIVSMIGQGATEGDLLVRSGLCTAHFRRVLQHLMRRGRIRAEADGELTVDRALPFADPGRQESRPHDAGGPGLKSMCS
ncbi:MAG: hypothetical protein ABI369_10390 [Acetobacteraceae bacterium]